jgi:hypothetical protein
VSRGDSHRTAVRAAAERAGLIIVPRFGGQTWDLVDPEGRGRPTWTVQWLRSGYFGGAHSWGPRSVDYRPDYRTHAATSTPRQILDRWLSAEFPPA